MKSTYKLILVLVISIFGYSTTTNAQNFTDTLETVYLNQSPESSLIKTSYSLLSDELIDMESINFSKEIRDAKKQKEHIVLSNGKEVLKSKFLKTLRSSANSTENINTFYKRVYTKIPELESIEIGETTLSKLYIAVKKNTLHGKLENTGKELSWL